VTAPPVLGLIVARGGSRGVPRKNLLALAGRPLVAHTVEAAQTARSLGRVIISSDDPEIIAAARAAGCEAPFVRPAELAGDRSSTVDVALHALDWLERQEGYRPDLLVLLPATAPLRTGEHIDGAVAALVADPSAEAVVAVTEAEYPPWWMLAIEQGRVRWLFPEGPRADHRQQLPPAYRPNGSIYAVRTPTLRAERTFYPPATTAYLMPREASVNVDSAVDFRLAELLLSRTGS
jgi:CMP-N,N'-diacetyllegionaminic acid synthase